MRAMTMAEARTIYPMMSEEVLQRGIDGNVLLMEGSTYVIDSFTEWYNIVLDSIVETNVT